MVEAAGNTLAPRVLPQYRIGREANPRRLKFGTRRGGTSGSGHERRLARYSITSMRALDLTEVIHRSGMLDHSITWSARCKRDGGIVRPRALAVLRLMTSSNLVGCSTGKVAGFAPLRILST
jgi:hypothetical protein